MDWKKSFLDKINLIVWDWNGTLINDVALSLDCMNELLDKYGLKRIGLKTYRRIFRFPVKDYYKDLGFDFSKTPFEQVGQEFIQLYNENFSKVTLQPGAEEVLRRLKDAGKKQVLISARNLTSLLEDVKSFGLEQYFDQIIGLNDDLAHGKGDLVKQFFEQNRVNPRQTLFIGDTTHDCEIARSLGAHYFMVANGHHSADRLMLCTQFVYANLLTLADFLFNA